MSNASFSLKLPQNPTVSNTILWSGLISGLLDAIAGVIVYFLFKGMNPIEVLQYIASGVFGTAAFSGGLLMAVAGLILHFVIAFAFAAGFFFVYPNIPLLSKNIWITGLLYGLFIWLFMNLLVLPNSNTPQSPRDFVSVVEIIWHMTLVGLPMALVTDRYYNAK
jgi:uncharacterized membrane protein YagU involved in acid resistance